MLTEIKRAQQYGAQGLIKVLSVAGLLLAINPVAQAQTTDSSSDTATRLTRSAEQYTRDATEDKAQLLESAETRNDAALIGNGTETNSLMGHTWHSDNSDYSLTLSTLDHGYTIASARTWLLQDDDGDGYHHHFAVSFDADVISGSAQVYAKLYLSLNRGPWNHYATTRIFSIHDNDIGDEYEVITALESGYPTGYYDVLIELYTAADHHLVTMYGPNEDYDLIDLPLEDESYDFDFYLDYDASYSVSGGCSLRKHDQPANLDPLLPLLLLSAMLYWLYRRQQIRREHVTLRNKP